MFGQNPVTNLPEHRYKIRKAFLAAGNSARQGILYCKGGHLKPRSIVITFLMALLLVACNLPAAEPTETPIPPTDTPSAPPTATVTPFPTELPTEAPTATSSVPMVTPIDEPVNCRFGPGTEYVSLGSGLAVGASAQIFGKTAGGDWWLIQNPSATSSKCWVAGSVTTASGNLGTVGVVAPPVAFVTKVTIKADPDSVSVPGCTGPIMPIALKGTIEVNGPASVKWHFETQQDGAMPEHTTDFTAFGTKNVSVDYTPTLHAGTYWVRLIVTSPNEMTAESTYKLCP
jgi:hypothetical protein